MVSTLCVGFSGSKSTRLLKHGIAGHMVEIVALSWMAKPCGRSSRNLSVSQPPDLGAWPGEATPVRTTSPARPIAGRNRVILITHLSEPKVNVPSTATGDPRGHGEDASGVSGLCAAAMFRQSSNLRNLV